MWTDFGYIQIVCRDDFFDPQENAQVVIKLKG